jgi:hypothetical protein
MSGTTFPASERNMPEDFKPSGLNETFDIVM